MNVTVRATEHSDAKCLKHWLQEPGILDFFPIDNERELDDTLRIWMSYGAKGATLTADVDGEPAGMLVLYLQPYEKLKHQCLFGIVVDKEMRGKGVGTALIKEAEKLAKKKHGIELLHLEVYKGNPALNLYKRLGYHVYGEQEHFLKEGPDKYRDKIVMQKGL